MNALTKEDVKNILSQRHNNNPYEKLNALPQPCLFKDMQKGAVRIKKAINSGEAIMIVGDYDVDGIISTTIMIEFFSLLGVKVEYFIPNRFKHGYGLSTLVIEEIFKNGFQAGVIITVDNGISSHEAAKMCKLANIDLIITDHHTVGENTPDAFAIINPKQSECEFPFKHICGAQVAWYFCAAIKNELEINIDMSQFFDLLSIAIISDIMPMRSLNYTLTKKGLLSLSEAKRFSLKYLFERFGRQNLKSDDIGFLLSPLLNSAGRLADPKIALKFLLSTTTKDASLYLEQLIALNDERKNLQKEILQDAITMVDDSNIICVWSEKWNEGVIGIIASLLSQKFKKPAFVFSIKNQVAKGSARSIGNINLYTLLSCATDLLISFGGHKSAAGLSLDVVNLKLLKNKLSQCLESHTGDDNNITQDYLGQLMLDDIDLDLFELINSFEPYGLENEKPLFLISGVKVHKISFFGKKSEFSKLVVTNNKVFKEVVFFDELLHIAEGSLIDIIASISKNSYNQEEKVQLLAKEIIKI